MSYIAITASQTDANSPVDQNLMDTIRLDLADHESRLLAAFTFGNNSILDDFVTQQSASGVAASVWETGGTAPDVVSQHQARVKGVGGGSFSIMAASPSKLQINIAEEYIAVMEMRVYKAAGTNDDFFFGFQDSALSSAAAATVGDKTDMIGFYRDAAAADWFFRTANTAGGGGSTTSGAIGVSTSWGIYRLTVTCSATAGNRQVIVEYGTSLAGMAQVSGSPFTTNLPTGVNLRPFFGVAPSVATTLDLRVDYCLAYLTGRPLAA